MTEKKETKPEYKDVYKVLSFVQKNLKAPKKRENKFGGYKYRNAEDILDGLKEVLPDGAIVTVEDDVVMVPISEESTDTKKGETEKSSGRVYMKATATIHFNGKEVKNVSYAREEYKKKGMDASQITGSTASYARKYALNGLFMIDDSQDADATNQHGKTKEDQKAADAFGGSIRDGVDEETRKQMYDQALKDLSGAGDVEKLKAVWTKIAKGKKVFTEEQWADLEQAKDEAKSALPPF